jgi:hypothetical protein
MLLNYNIPPCLTTNNFFVMFTFLIPWKKSITSDNFDVYLQPIMEELQQLWEGVFAYDVLKPMDSKTFTLKGVLLWTIHDFLGYGCVVGVAHQRYVACPICKP